MKKAFINFGVYFFGFIRNNYLSFKTNIFIFSQNFIYV